jgi:hypothetical protein
VVFVWAQIPGTADPAGLRAIPSFRPAATVLIGGPGWRTDVDAPGGVTWVTDLNDTITRIARAVGE